MAVNDNGGQLGATGAELRAGLAACRLRADGYLWRVKNAGATALGLTDRSGGIQLAAEQEVLEQRDFFLELDHVVLLVLDQRAANLHFLGKRLDAALLLCDQFVEIG